MDLTFDRVLEFVRSVLSSDEIPPDEITMESHLYFDLQFDSTDFVALATFTEIEFNLSLSEHYLYIPATTDEEQTQAEQLMWEVYRLSTTASLREYLDRLEFSSNAVKRVEEIEEFCKQYRVKPFTVGCLCACIIHVARNATNG